MRKRSLRFLAWVAIMLLVAAGVIFTVPGSRYLALGYLRQEPFRDNMPASYYVRALQSPDPKTRQEAAKILGTIDGAEGRALVPALARALEDADDQVRVNAALALYKIGPDAREAVPALIVALRDKENRVRMDAAMTLFRIGPDAREAVPALIAAMQAAENKTSIMSIGVTIRAEAAQALGRIGPDAREAVPALRDALRDDDPAMRSAAQDALRRINPEALDKAGAVGGR
jgi:HEAT repeat protein